MDVVYSNTPEREEHREVARLRRVLRRFDHVRQRSPREGLVRYRAKCPAHDGQSFASLSISQLIDTGQVLVHCFAGCATDDVLGATGLTWSDLGARGDGPAKGQPCAPKAVRGVLAALEAELDEDVRYGHFRGKAGHTDRSLLVALMKVAAKHGTLIPSGVRTSISMRALALEAGISLPTAAASLGRLRNREVRPRRCGEPWLSRDDAGRAPTEAGAVVLRVRGAVNLNAHLPSSLGYASVKDSRAPSLRWSGLGKKAETVVQVLARREAPAHVKVLAAEMGDRRPRDLLRTTPGRLGAVRRLEELGIVKVRGDVVELAPNWREALERAREELGELAAHDRDQARYERQRVAFAEELERRRRERQERRERMRKEAQPRPQRKPRREWYWYEEPEPEPIDPERERELLGDELWEFFYGDAETETTDSR